MRAPCQCSNDTLLEGTQFHEPFPLPIPAPDLTSGGVCRRPSLNAQQVKLTDFGIARELDHAGAMVETVVGTVRYMSPERLHGEAYGRPADVWGLGLVMIECVTQVRRREWGTGHEATLCILVCRTYLPFSFLGL